MVDLKEKLQRVKGYTQGKEKLAQASGISGVLLTPVLKGNKDLSKKQQIKVVAVIDTVLLELEAMHEESKKTYNDFFEKFMQVKSFYNGPLQLALASGLKHRVILNYMNSKASIPEAFRNKIEVELEPLLKILTQAKIDRESSQPEFINKLIKVKTYHSGLVLLSEWANVSVGSIELCIKNGSKASNKMRDKLEQVLDIVIERLEKEQAEFIVKQKECMTKLHKVADYYSGRVAITQASGISENTIYKILNDKIELTRNIYSKIQPVIDDVLIELERKKNNKHLTQHGKYITYRDGCRCDDCRIAWRNYIRELNQRKTKKAKHKYSS